MRLRYAKGSPAVYCSSGIPAGVPAAGGLWGAGRSTMLFSLRDVLVFCQMLLNGGLAKGCCECMLEMTFEQLYMPFCWQALVCNARWNVCIWTSGIETIDG